jgi:hypothetical protein
MLLLAELVGLEVDRLPRASTPVVNRDVCARRSGRATTNGGSSSVSWSPESKSRYQLGTKFVGGLLRGAENRSVVRDSQCASLDLIQTVQRGLRVWWSYCCFPWIGMPDGALCRRCGGLDSGGPKDIPRRDLCGSAAYTA